MKITNAIFENRLFYYHLMKDFLDHKINTYHFKNKFMHQRNKDIEINALSDFSEYYENRNLSENEKKFVEEYSDKLYSYNPTNNVNIILDEYVIGAKKYRINGPLFFDAIFSDLFVNIRDFWPRNLKEAETAGWQSTMDEFGFAELSEEEYKNEYCIDEEQLRKKVQEKFKILEENKEIWMIEKQELQEGQS